MKMHVEYTKGGREGETDFEGRNRRELLEAVKTLEKSGYTVDGMFLEDDDDQARQRQSRRR